MKRRHFNALALALALPGSWTAAQAQTAGSAGGPAAPPAILIVGDSLSAEYGLRRGTGWVALLEQRLASEKRRARVVNASVSGETTSGGRSRLPALLRQHQPAVVVLELGGNDALRGLPLNMTRDNLADMARQARAAGAQVLILGMDMPPNYGTAYAREFRELFVTVAREQKTALVPFFLKDVADLADPTSLFQNDRIHPNEAAQATMLANVWPELRKLLPR
ncbi:MAG: arylesterase [Hydrogenophaga sp.]|nr:arylesterase [Hydrogenophaga sp.]